MIIFDQTILRSDKIVSIFFGQTDNTNPNRFNLTIAGQNSLSGLLNEITRNIDNSNGFIRVMFQRHLEYSFDASVPLSLINLGIILSKIRTFEPRISNGHFREIARKIKSVMPASSFQIEDILDRVSCTSHVEAIEEITPGTDLYVRATSNRRNPTENAADEQIRSYNDWSNFVVPRHTSRPYLIAPHPDIFNQDLERAIRASLQEQTPAVTTSPIHLDSGANAKALEGLDIEVPNELICPLSLEIMTDPVYFEDLKTRQCFERAFIEDHIRRGGKHPTTREDSKKLVANEQLKKECDEFVAKATAPKIVEVPAQGSTAVPVAPLNTLIEMKKKRSCCQIS